MTDHIIKAEAHTDDHRHQVKFDAAPYFSQASDEDLRSLADCGWGGDYPADQVAEYLDGIDAAVTGFFENKHAGPRQGFECTVDQATAEAWLMTHRPALHAQIVENPESGVSASASHMRRP